MKVGDMVRLKNIDELKKENTWKTATCGVTVDSMFINQDMYPMFGKSWKVIKTFNSHEYIIFDFELKDEFGLKWKFKESWIDKNIMEIDELFDDLFIEIEL
jgi:hypothetical protein